MTFNEFKKVFQRNFYDMVADVDHLYEIEIDKDEFWNLYLDSFPAGTNEIYRERREFDCSCCRQFIRNIGNAVVIKDNKIHTMWDFKVDDAKYQTVIDALNTYLMNKAVTNVYISKFSKIGTDKNFEQLMTGQIVEWDHFYLELPPRFVDKSHRSVGDIQGEFRDTKNVFKRSLEEIEEDAIQTVLELISSNSLYKGEEWESALKDFLSCKLEYDNISKDEKDNYTWVKSLAVGPVIGRIRNHSIGKLLVDISDGVELDTAVRSYELIVAPSNYKRPKAIYTKRMLEEAKKTIEELGYMESLDRRFATLDDITVNNILFSNKDAAKRISGGVFDEMLRDATHSPKQFSRVEEVPVEKFISDILPHAQSLEAYLEGRHSNNLVSLIAPANPESQTMFKWNNGFSWAYTGNVTDSDIKRNVKSAGGKVDGVLRFSIQWNDTDYNPNDFDAHCITPDKSHICFHRKHDWVTNGDLDVDIINPTRNIPAVENITWPELRSMTPGTYQFGVHCYTDRGGSSGFRAEIEFNGEIHSFEYNKPVRTNTMVPVAYVELDKNGNFTIKELLSSNVSSKEIWGVKTNQFIPVSVVMYSPNYWDDQHGIGNKHYMFMLKDCVNPEQPNGFYNEFLKQELVQHKRVFEALGSKMSVEPVDDQLSGIGFSSTIRNDLVVKVKGAAERIIKIKF